MCFSVCSGVSFVFLYKFRFSECVVIRSVLVVIVVVIGETANVIFLVN